MPSPAADRRDPVPVKPIVVLCVLALALALRIAHLSGALLSPLSYQPGPDEDYYQRFGAAVAGGHDTLTPEFTFMDPAYGYLLGAVFRILGINLFAVYLLQALLDVATAYGVYRIGASLGRPRAGVVGAALYALTSTAILFSATLLKETCVTAWLTWWVVAALGVLQSRRSAAWLAFGVYCGIGVALRSNLLLAGAAALLLPLLAPAPPAAAPAAAAQRAGLRRAALVLAGLLCALLPWSLRNAAAGLGPVPLPANGGIVLHQVYNDANPDSSIWIPPFVSYLHPSEIWRGYAAEASRRAGHPLAPAEVDRYWRSQALGYIGAHPGAVLQTIASKALAFLSSTEVPNNRSAAEERMFSPVLNALPPPATWLLALGLPGLAWLGRSDRRWPVVALPILLSWCVFALFWAEDRFRVHAMGALALCSGIWLEALLDSLRARAALRVAPLLAGAALIAALSLWLGSRSPPPLVRWDHIVWGYVKMGRNADAERIARRVLAGQPDNAPLLEALGVIGAREGRYAEARDSLERALTLRPSSHVAHYNLAKVWLALGDRARAETEARRALQLYPSDEYAQLLRQVEAAP
jgi:tetratricopeptide (TPR) repeat protein